MEFLILGTSKCEYCTRAKLMLEDEDILHKYVDLAQAYPDWREVFQHSSIVSLLEGRPRTIPIIFRKLGGGMGGGMGDSKGDSKGITLPYAEGDWQFVGGYNELRDLLLRLANNSDQY